MKGGMVKNVVLWNNSKQKILLKIFLFPSRE